MTLLSAVAIGLDVGATKLVAGLVDRAGRIVWRQELPTGAARGGEAVLNDARAAVRSGWAAAAAAGRQIAGLGIGVCELVDLAGNVTSRYTVDWEGIPVHAAFQPEISRAVLEADVRAHAWAEAAIGAGRGLESFVFVSVGSGISSCLVLHGRPYAGVRGNALVLATMPVTVFGEEDRPIEFALEPFASGIGLTQRYQRQRPGVGRVEEIIADASAGSEVAAAILQSGGAALGSALGWLVNVLDPAAVIVGGGLGMADGLYWESAVANARAHIFAAGSRDVPILHSMCGPDAGLIGVGLRVFEE